MKTFDPLAKKQILHNVGKFFDNPNDSIVYKIKIPTDALYGLLDHDLAKTFSNHIDFAQTQDLNEIDANLNKYNTSGWPSQLNCIRILYKIIWLLKDIERQGRIVTPFQFIKTQYGYMVHPGTTKLLVSAYLNPIDIHEGFYVHSPQIDHEGLLLNYETGKIDKTEDFISLFDFDQFYFKFRTLSLSNRTKLKSHSYVPENYYSYYQTFKNVRYNTITYYDNYDPVWVNELCNRDRFNNRLSDLINFTSNDTCVFYNIHLKKFNGIWIKV